MVKHIILWKLNPELSEEEKAKVKAEIKAGLEGLVGKVPGLLEVTVHIDGRLDSSNADVMLDSTLEIKTQTLYSVRAYLCITHCHMSRMWSIAFKSLCTFESTIEHYICI